MEKNKTECTYIIKQLLEYYGIDPAIHYVNYPEEEFSEFTSDTFNSSADPLETDDENEADGNVDLNTCFPRQHDEVKDIEDEFRRFEEEQPMRNYVLLSRSAKKRKHYIGFISIYF